jgi:hypothetical protein
MLKSEMTKKSSFEPGVRTFLYNLSHSDYVNSKFTCDLYKGLRRGKRQKVLSVSYYDEKMDVDKLKASLLKLLMSKVEVSGDSDNLDWLIRVYHNDSIDAETICNVECEMNNVDFCNVDKLMGDVMSLDKRIMRRRGDSFNKNDRSNNELWSMLPREDSFVESFYTVDLKDDMVFDKFRLFTKKYKNN